MTVTKLVLHKKMSRYFETRRKKECILMGLAAHNNPHNSYKRKENFLQVLTPS